VPPEPMIPPMRPEPARDGRGRYLLKQVDSDRPRAWTRVSTLAKCMSDTYHLDLWKRRMVALGVASEPDIAALVLAAGEALSQATDREEIKAAKEALNELCDRAHAAAGGDQGSELGTALHSLTEWADAGRLGEIEVPEQLWPDLDAYSTTMGLHAIDRPAEWIERIIANSVVDCAGTFDRILVMPEPCERCGKQLRIGDLKTQKSLDFGYLEIAIQLATYANADHTFHPETGEPEDLPDVCRCVAIVMWLPVGKARCTLHEIDIARGWQYATLGRDVRGARQAGKSLGRPYRRRSVESAGGQLTYLIKHAEHPDALAALWREASARGAWTAAHTEAARARKAALLAGVGS
jgi:hypothetical protein